MCGFLWEFAYLRDFLQHNNILPSDLGSTSDTRLGKLAVDKLESCLAVFLSITLMGSSVVPV
jgi:hypothetical protein